MTKLQITGYALIVVAVIILIVVGYTNSKTTKVPVVFSEKDMLSVLWNNYKDSYLEKGTLRALDKQQDNITTSEGQSYTLLRAVWMDDKETYDTAYKWTEDNLKRKEDNLHSWLFGKLPNGRYGVLTERGGYNSATDADIDIAVSLIFAAHRWQEQDYLDDAQKLVADIWNKNVIIIKGVPYLTANNLEKTSTENPIINVSYFAPYAFRLFAEIDSTHNWKGLVDSSYDVLQKTAASNLDKGSSAHVPPDWIVLNKSTLAVEKSTTANLTTNFSYDALRTPWRIALDYAWYKEPRAKQYLDSLAFLSQQWNEQQTIASVYAHDGTVLTSGEAPAMYGGIIGYFKVSDPDNGKKVYDQKLKFLFNPDLNAWKSDLSYYDENWAWFGIGLYNDLLPNLATS